MDERNTLEQNIDRWQPEGGVLEDARPAVDAAACALDVTRSRALQVLRLSRKIAVAVAGGSVLLVGIALIVLPGPAIVVIPLGLALLATEFRWAGRLLGWMKERVARVVGRARRVVADRSPT